MTVHARTFRYAGFTFDLASGVARFNYMFEGGSGDFPLTDIITFPVPEKCPAPTVVGRVERAIELLYVAVGLTYYKILAPQTVVIGDGVRLAPAARRWAVELYRQGLAEFAYRNDVRHILDLDLLVEARPPADAAVRTTGSAGGPLVAIGGGKDSLVSVEAIKAAGLSPAVFTLERTPLLGEVVALTGLPALRVLRVADPRAVPLLALEGAFRGHVPVTAGTSLMGVVTALLFGLGPVVMSNERSASSPNLTWNDREINHQWAKSVHAEELLRDALEEHVGLLDACFSLLSGMSELHVAQLFSAIDHYDRKVTSCNAAFRKFGNRRAARWCYNCDKCRFVFLALACFMPRSRVTSIFEGTNMLEDIRHVPGYRELLGLASHKPFECVGEITESRVALRLLSEDASWASAAVVRALRAEFPDWPADRDVAEVFTARPPRFAPEEYVLAIAKMQAMHSAAQGVSAGPGGQGGW